MSIKYGSYRYDSFEEKAQVQEFERLYRQASTLLDIEKTFWPMLGIERGKRILDLGCGSGVITHELSKQASPSHVVGCDISQTLLKKGQEAYGSYLQSSAVGRKEESISFHQGSVYSLPFSESSFDIVYARLLFQHLNEPLKALENILNVLKPGGRVCIVDVDKGWSSLYPEPETSVALDEAMIQEQLSQGGDPWVGRKLSNYLKSSGFSQVQTNVSLVDSDRIGLSKFFNMLSLGGAYQTKQNKFSSLKEKTSADIQSLTEGSYTWAGFGLFVVTGVKR